MRTILLKQFLKKHYICSNNQAYSKISTRPHTQRSTSMFPPIQQDPNHISLQQEQYENREMQCRIRCAALDTVQRETIALIAGIAEAQIEVIDNFLKPTTEPRDFKVLTTNLQEKLSQIKQDIVADYESLIGARDCFLDHGQLIQINKEVKKRLKDDFERSLTQIFDQSINEMSCNNVASVEQLKAKLSERVKVKKELANGILDAKTRITEEMHAILSKRDSCAKMRKALLSCMPTDIFTACDVGATTFLKKEIKKQWTVSRKKFVNTPNANGTPALHIAALRGHNEAIKLLLHYGADANLKDALGYTALHWAAKCGSVPCIQTLFAQKVPLDALGEYERTPLHMSVYNGHAQATIFLLNNRAPINAQTSSDDNCKTALHDAVIHQDEALVDTLTRYQGLDVNIKDKLGWTPLRHAIISGNRCIIAFILQHRSWKACEDKADANHIDQLLALTPQVNQEEVQRLVKDFCLGTNQSPPHVSSQTLAPSAADAAADSTPSILSSTSSAISTTLSTIAASTTSDVDSITAQLEAIEI